MFFLVDKSLNCSHSHDHLSPKRRAKTMAAKKKTTKKAGKKKAAKKASKKK